MGLLGGPPRSHPTPRAMAGEVTGAWRVHAASLCASLGFLATWHLAWLSPEQGFQERKAEICTPTPEVTQQCFGHVLFDTTPVKTLSGGGGFRRARCWGMYG